MATRVRGAMTVRLRMQRWGRRHRPFYRIVAAFSRKPRDGKFLEILGTYNPLPDKRCQAMMRKDVAFPGHAFSKSSAPWSPSLCWLARTAGPS